VGDVDSRDAQFLLDALEFGPHLRPQLRVEVRQRLVHEEHLRVPDDGATQCDPLLLAARELLRTVVEQLRDLQQARGLFDPLPGFLVAVLVGEPESERHVLPDGHVGVQRVVLEDHRDIAVLWADVVDDVVTDGNLAGSDRLQTGGHPQRRGLPTARGPDHDEKLAVLDGQVDLADGEGVLAVDFGDIR